MKACLEQGIPDKKKVDLYTAWKCPYIMFFWSVFPAGMLGLCERSIIKMWSKMIHSQKLFAVLAKSSIIDVWQGPVYASTVDIDHRGYCHTTHLLTDNWMKHDMFSQIWLLFIFKVYI